MIFFLGCCACLFIGFSVGYAVAERRRPLPILLSVPIRHDDFLDACEDFKQAMLRVPIEKRVFESQTTWQ